MTPIPTAFQSGEHAEMLAALPEMQSLPDATDLVAYKVAQAARLVPRGSRWCLNREG